MRSRRPCSAWRRSSCAAPTWACTTTRRPPRAGRAARGSSRATPTARRWRPTCRSNWAARATRSRRAGCSARVSRRARRPASRWRAAAKGIELATLEVRATSRSDARGLLGMADADGRAGARRAVRRAAARAHRRAQASTRSRLRALVEDGYRCSPIPSARDQRGAGRPAHRRRRGIARADGRAVGDPARRAPRRRDLHQRPVHGALVLPVAAAPTRRRRSSSPAPSAW